MYTGAIYTLLAVAVLDFKNWGGGGVGKYKANQNNARTFFYSLQLLLYYIDLLYNIYKLHFPEFIFYFIFSKVLSNRQHI